MKRTCIFFCSLGLLLGQLADAQTRTRASIEHATVFLNGAELFSTAAVSLPQGTSEVLFSNIAGNVNQQSLTIGADNDVVVQSAIFQNNYLQAEIASPVVRRLEDSLEQIAGQSETITAKLSTVREQLSLLSENRKVAGENNGLSVAELQKMLDLVGSRMTALLAEKGRLEKSLAKLTEGAGLIRLQIEEEKKKGFQPGGQLLVKFYSPKATNTRVRMSYVVPNAGWKPAYDIRVDDLTKPVRLFYKANVYQNSGVKWEGVRLTLSTGNPNEGAQAPVLQPWHLAYYQPVYGAQLKEISAGQYRTRNSNDAAALSGNTYQQKSGEAVSIGGARPNGTMYMIDGVATNNAAGATMNSYVAVDNSGVNTSFDIELEYTIPSDGKEQIVAVKTYELPATYRHFAVPRLDRDAFLQAQVTNWEDLNLLPAPTSIFYEGSYVGQGIIDMRNVRDTMNISLGRDKKVVIRREMDKKLRSVRTIGSNVRETFAYTISVRNSRKEKVNLTLQDQFPLSNESSIEVEDKEVTDASVDEATGAITWKLALGPSETTEKKLSYTIKYPKGRSLANVRH